MSKKLILTTDASGVAIAGVLSQGDIGNDRPVAFISRTLNEAEQRYSTIEREMLAIFWSIKQLRPYLLGQEFIVRCDHKPIQFIFKTKDIHPRIYRWTYYLSHFTFVVIHYPGKDNVVADALSRAIPDENEKQPDHEMLPFAVCNVVTKAAKKKELENAQEKAQERNIENDSNSRCESNFMNDFRLLNKNFDNCASYIADSYDFNCNLIEKNINQMKNIKAHQFKLLTQQKFNYIDKPFNKIDDDILYS